MNYRVGRVEDLPGITSMLCMSGYYSPVDTGLLGGAWIVAEHEDKIVGCVWAFSDGVNAFVDYLYVQPRFRTGRVAIRLMAHMEALLRQAGVRHVRANFKEDNTGPLRLARAAGMWTDGGYALGFKEL